MTVTGEPTKKPLVLRLDTGLGVRAAVRNLLEQVQSRRSTRTARPALRKLMRNMVHAKLEIAIGYTAEIRRAGKAGGDFTIADVSIHVTNAPNEALLRKCKAAIEACRIPLIISSRMGTAVAEGLAENLHIADSVDIIEFEQFIATNVYELTLFKSEQRRLKIGAIIEKYNEIVRAHETDPSLLIEVATGKN